MFPSLPTTAPRHRDRGGERQLGLVRYTYANLMQGGYPHAVHLVNRRGEPVHGQSSRSTWSRSGIRDRAGRELGG